MSSKSKKNLLAKNKLKRRNKTRSKSRPKRKSRSNDLFKSFMNLFKFTKKNKRGGG